MADYGPGYDPSQADYISPGDQAIGGLIGLSAFALIGIGAFFTVEAVILVGIEALEAATITYGAGTITAGTATFLTAGVELTTGQMLYLAEITASEISLSSGAVAAILESWGLEMFSLEGIIALAAFNTSTPPLMGHYHNLISYVDFYGESLAPQDPGGPGQGQHPTPPPHGGWVCYTEDDTHVTTCCFTPF